MEAVKPFAHHLKVKEMMDSELSILLKIDTIHPTDLLQHNDQPDLLSLPSPLWK